VIEGGWFDLRVFVLRGVHFEHTQKFIGLHLHGVIFQDVRSMVEGEGE